MKLLEEKKQFTFISKQFCNQIKILTKENFLFVNRSHTSLRRRGRLPDPRNGLRKSCFLHRTTILRRTYGSRSLLVYVGWFGFCVRISR
jgi:hypothetical protein